MLAFTAAAAFWDPAPSAPPCPGALVDGECWRLSSPSQSCADLCGGATRVDAETTVGDSTSEEVVYAIEATYGLHDTSKDSLNARLPNSEVGIRTTEAGGEHRAGGAEG